MILNYEIDTNIEIQNLTDLKVLKNLMEKRRQVIMVTHNPNLAIVSDSDQVVYVSIDKKNGNQVNVISGSIENQTINNKIVDILEGTMFSFKRRDLKYIKDKAIVLVP